MCRISMYMAEPVDELETFDYFEQKVGQFNALNGNKKQWKFH